MSESLYAATIQTVPRPDSQSVIAALEGQNALMLKEVPYDALYDLEAEYQETRWREEQLAMSNQVAELILADIGVNPEGWTMSQARSQLDEKGQCWTGYDVNRQLGYNSDVDLRVVQTPGTNEGQIILFGSVSGSALSMFAGFRVTEDNEVLLTHAMFTKGQNEEAIIMAGGRNFTRNRETGELVENERQMNLLGTVRDNINQLAERTLYSPQYSYRS